MLNWRKNVSKLNGINIKHSDMEFEMKECVTKLMADIFLTPELTPIKISKFLSDSLNERFPTGWVCLIGKEFVANISHEPRNFIRMSHEGLNFLVYKANSK